MSDYDSADLLRRAKKLARRPDDDSSIDDTDWYDWLTVGDAEVKTAIVTLAPDAQYGPPVLLTTSDGGATFGFGVDADGDPIFPIGHSEIYTSKKQIPDEPLEPAVDFMIEGTKIRIPNDRTRAFPDGAPYARFVMTPTRIDDTHPPTLQPKTARIATVYAALEQWASRPGSGADPAYWSKKKADAIAAAVRVYRTQYNMQAAIGNATSFARSLSLLDRSY